MALQADEAIESLINKLEHISASQVTAHFLVYGHRGWIGGEIVNCLQAMQRQPDCAYNIQLTLGSVRVHDATEVEAEIQSVCPTHIISAIGRTHGVLDDGTKIKSIDYLESMGKTKQNVHDNLFAPMMLALLATKYGIHLTYLGTGCIFHYETDEKNSYDLDKTFTERDTPNFFGSQYSILKGFTDQLMQLLQHKKNVLNVRIRMPITDDLECERNLITKLISYKMIGNIPNSMTNLDDLIPVMIDMALTNKHGTINLANPGTITHDEILKMYQEIIDKNHTWTNVTIDELQKKHLIKAARSNNALDTTKLVTWYPNQIKPIKESVRHTLIRIKKK
eukprot:46410_1